MFLLTHGRWGHFAFRFLLAKHPSGNERGETAVFAGYHFTYLSGLQANACELYCSRAVVQAYHYIPPFTKIDFILASVAYQSDNNTSDGLLWDHWTSADI